MPGKVVDPAVGELLVELMTPMTLEITLAVQRELEARATETDRLRQQHIERTRHDCDLARRRYMTVDPDNRLVANTLEAEWNEKLRLHTDVVENCGRHSAEDAIALDLEMQQRIGALANEFPRIWNDPRVDMRERKRILRLLVTDVTLIKTEAITVNVRLSGGATRTLTRERPLPIAQILNERGRRTWEGKTYNLKKVAFIRAAYSLSSRRQRLRDRGMLTTREVAEHFAIAETTVHQWGRQGLISKVCCDNLSRSLWDIPPELKSTRGRPGRNAIPAHRATVTVASTEKDSV